MPAVAGLQVTVTELIVAAAACTVTDAVPDLVASCTLVAVTSTVPADDGAVSNPAGVMLPLLEDQLTPEAKIPAPCTVAEHCDVAAGAMVAGAQVTRIELIVGAAGSTVTDAEPDFDVSSALVAITETWAAEEGAVSNPLEPMLPLLDDQVTPEEYVPVPCTVAVHCDCAPIARVDGEQDTETSEMVEATGAGWPMFA